MRKKVLFPILALVLALGLAVPVAASPDSIWTIGTQDGTRNEFKPDSNSETSYIVGTSLLTDFPGWLQTTGGTSGPNHVDIHFTTTEDYCRVSLDYWRMGGETNEVEFDGTLLGTCAGPTDPYASTLYTFPVPWLVTAGLHTITITLTTGGNGSHWIDFLELTGIKPPEKGKGLKGLKGQAGKSNVAFVELWEKDTSWDIVDDGAWGKLKYNLAGPEFDFVFNGHGLETYTDYSLIHYPEPQTTWPWPVTEIASGTSNDEGDIHLAGSVDLDTDLVCDKIWLVLSDDCPSETMTGWDPTEYLFEYDLISYDDTDA